MISRVHKVLFQRCSENLSHLKAETKTLSKDLFRPVLTKLEGSIFLVTVVVPRSPLRVGELMLDMTQPLVRLADRTVVLTPVEYGLLTCLARQVGSLVRADELLEQVWGAGYAAKPLLLQATITRLRKKLEPDPVHPLFLLTQAGRGYRLADPAGNTRNTQSG